MINSASAVTTIPDVFMTTLRGYCENLVDTSSFWMDVRQDWRAVRIVATECTCARRTAGWTRPRDRRVTDGLHEGRGLSPILVQTVSDTTPPRGRNYAAGGPFLHVAAGPVR